MTAVLTVTVNPAIDQTVWIPGFTAGEVRNRVDRSATRPGGKGINVAARLRELDTGIDVTATGLLGAANASVFEEFLADRRVVDRLVRRAGSTRIGIKIVDPAGRDTTDINFPGETPSNDTLIELEGCVAELAGASTWVVLSGSLPPGVPTDTYRRLTEVAHAAGASVAVDTSGEPLAEALAAGPDLVKPNREELAELVGHELADRSQVLAAALELHERGVATVVVSLGGDGALFMDSSAAVVASPLPVEVISTVGAGDAMVAGTIAAMLRSSDSGGTSGRDRLRRVAAFATASAADAISHQVTSGTGSAGGSATTRVAEMATQVQIDDVTPVGGVA